MKHFRPFLLLFVLLLLNASAAEQPLAQSTIVLYNKAVSDSVELAKFYAEQRGIAADHLIGLTCSTEEEISREEYDRTVADPLREIFKQRHWWTLFENFTKRISDGSIVLFTADFFLGRTSEPNEMVGCDATLLGVKFRELNRIRDGFVVENDRRLR